MQGGIRTVRDLEEPVAVTAVRLDVIHRPSASPSSVSAVALSSAIRIPMLTESVWSRPPA